MNIYVQNDRPNKDANLELRFVLIDSQYLLIETIKSYGVTTPTDYFYDQAEYEWVCIIEGEAELTIEGVAYQLKRGATFMIAPHQKHQVTYASLDCVWLCLFLRNPR